MKQLLLSVLLFLSLNTTFAQKVKVISSSSQTWAGGQCCSYGINYTITLETTDTISLFRFDTVWINKQSYVKGTSRPLYVTETKLNGKRCFTISAAGSWGGRDVFGEVVEPEKTEDAPGYKGKALIVYHVGKNRYTQEIKEFVELHPIAYP